MLGRDLPFDDVPFFRTHHYDLEVRYVGHADRWDGARMGSIAGRNRTTRFFRNGRLRAAASIGRDFENLEIAAELARGPPA